jgi:hypothetical protein
MRQSTKLTLHIITSTAALKCGGEVWVLNKKECQQFETADMKFPRSLLALTGQTVKGTQQVEKNWKLNK